MRKNFQAFGLIVLCYYCTFALFGCAQPISNPNKNSEANTEEAHATSTILNPKGENIETRFNPPQGYERQKAEKNTFASYLRSRLLRQNGSDANYYDGRKVSNSNIYAAVLAMDIGSQNLQQCADATIRLWAEYLFQQKQYTRIHFNFTNGFSADYSKWAEGSRIKVAGNKAEWYKAAKQDYSYNTFRKYLDMVFMYAGTLSLAKEMQAVDYDGMSIGDVLIQGGSPGHAVMVVDMAVNLKTGKKVYLLAESYMPAQDIHLLVNRNNPEFSPWYALDDEVVIETPQWTFESTNLKRFKN